MIDGNDGNAFCDGPADSVVDHAVMYGAAVQAATYAPIGWDLVGGRSIHYATSAGEAPRSKLLSTHTADGDALTENYITGSPMSVETPTLMQPCQTCWAVGRVTHTHSRHCYVGMSLHTGEALCPIPVDVECPACKGKGTTLRKVSLAVALVHDDAPNGVVVIVEGVGRHELGRRLNGIEPHVASVAMSTEPYCLACDVFDTRGYQGGYVHREGCSRTWTCEFL